MLCIQRRCLPLPRRAFSYVTQLRFQSTDAWSRPLLNDIRVFHACRIPEECVPSHFCLYQVVFVHCILCHFRISLTQILYQEVHISRARNFPRAYTTSEKYFFLESAWMCNCGVYIVGVFHCLVLRLAM